jgi:hypothetical protein
MAIKTISLTFLALLVFSEAQAAPSKTTNFDLHVGFAKGSARFANAKTPGKPVTFQYNVGATYRYPLAEVFYVGASADFNYVIQATDVAGEWGNRRGSRMNYFSPTVGIVAGKLHLKYDYQFLGRYTLDKKDSTGNEVYYTKPKGHRVYLGYKFGESYELGLAYEKVDYKKEVLEKTTKTETELSDTKLMQVKHIGLMAVLAF